MTKWKTMSEDLLRREVVIEAIHNYWKKRLDTLPTKESECGEVYADIQQVDKILEHNKILCNFINALPSADRPQGWIPCSERLPSKKEVVLITNDKGNVRCGQFRGTDGKDWIWKGNTLETVLAWMPLPEPWKGERDD